MKNRLLSLALAVGFFPDSLEAKEKRVKPTAIPAIEKRKNQIAYIDLEFASVGKVLVLMDLYVLTNTKCKPQVALFFTVGHGGMVQRKPATYIG